MSSTPMIEQTAGKGAARYARRKLGMVSGTRRAGWVTYVILTAVLLISVYPLYYAIQLASSDAATIARNPIPPLLPQGNLFANIDRVLNSDINFWRAFWNSVIVSSVTAIFLVIFSTLAGYAFAKLRFKGRGPLLIFVIATMAVPMQLGIVPLFIVMSRLGLTGNLAAVIIPNIVTAFGVFWMTQYLSQALPYELIEAARMDGCSMIKTFLHVALPAAMPAASMLALFTFVAQWTNFFWPFIVLDASNPTLPVALQLLQASYFKDYSLIMAGVVISTLPLILVFIITGRRLVAGVMEGAVKG
ncbi:MAG TPA: carbohydrate ABC transporter permease [Propionibacterium sp.]|nr:carbohydrate ABC transporter permease [Propionibacterium sp.]